MRTIDADALLERIKKDPLFPLVEEYGISGVIKVEPTVEAIPIEWIKMWMEWQNSWNLEGVITLMRDWNERNEE